jgi:hypothetical protein
MDTKNSPKKLTPPYLSWKTFVSYIESMRQAIPPRIDKSMMTRLSGLNQSLMMNSFLYLDLIDKEGVLSPTLTQLIETSATEKRGEFKAILNKVLLSSYSFLFDSTGTFDLAKSSSGDFDKKFEAQGVSGQTVGKCEAFFIAAAKEAGIKLSPYILDVKRRGPKGGSSSRTRNNKNDGKQNDETPPPPIENPKPPVQELSVWYLTFKPAFDKLPKFGEAYWTSAQREKWIALVTATVDAYVEVDDGKKSK